MEKRPMLAIVLLLILPWVNSFVLKKENGEKGTLQRLITFTCNWTTWLQSPSGAVLCSLGILHVSKLVSQGYALFSQSHSLHSVLAKFFLFKEDGSSRLQACCWKEKNQSLTISEIEISDAKLILSKGIISMGDENLRKLSGVLPRVFWVSQRTRPSEVH